MMHDDSVLSVAFSKDSEMLASGSQVRAFCTIGLSDKLVESHCVFWDRMVR